MNAAAARTTVICAPNVPGLVRWLCHVYQTDPKAARRILRTGWPRLTASLADAVLTGSLSLADALGAEAPDRD